MLCYDNLYLADPYDILKQYFFSRNGGEFWKRNVSNHLTIGHSFVFFFIFMVASYYNNSNSDRVQMTAIFQKYSWIKKIIRILRNWSCHITRAFIFNQY